MIKDRRDPPTQRVSRRSVVAFAVVAVVAAACSSSVAPTTGGSPTTSAAPSASATTPGPTATAAPSAARPTVPPVSTTAWTGLTVTALAAAPAGIVNVFSWSGGYLAIAQADPNAAQTAWRSIDGRTWSELPASTLALDSRPFPDGISVSAGSGCGTGLIVSTEDTAGQDTVWYSADGTTWTKVNLSGAPLMFAGGSEGTVAVTTTGTGTAGRQTSTWFSADCTNWSRVTLPGPSGASANAVAAFGAGFAAVGSVGPVDGGPTTKPLAWWSRDGQHWTAATVPASPGFAFYYVFAGPDGLFGETTDPGVTPGATDLWTSTDGRTWKPQPASLDPLGIQSTGEGVGNPNGGFAGDGNRLRLFGNRTFDGTAPNEFWTSSDATHWTKVSISGPDTSTVLASDTVNAFLMRDGVLFSDVTGTWFGTATP
jgi:hypothetical protein